jgi:hypothetical protein
MNVPRTIEVLDDTCPKFIPKVVMEQSMFRCCPGDILIKKTVVPSWGLKREIHGTVNINVNNMNR